MNIIGHCGKCGAPYIDQRFGKQSERLSPTCKCWNIGPPSVEVPDGLPATADIKINTDYCSEECPGFCNNWCAIFGENLIKRCKYLRCDKCKEFKK